jgi:hypothetical protein
LVDLPIEGHLPDFDRATSWLYSTLLTAADLPERLSLLVLDLHLHQLASHARLPPRAGRQVQGSRVYRRRRRHARVPSPTRRRNVRQAAKDLRVDYPIVPDTDYATWRAFNNQYWLALELIYGEHVWPLAEPAPPGPRELARSRDPQRAQAVLLNPALIDQEPGFARPGGACARCAARLAARAVS